MFLLVDEYHGLRMDVDTATPQPGRLTVVETPCRLAREWSYGYFRALWWLWWEDGRRAISTPPDTADAVRRVAQGVRRADELADPALAEWLKHPVNAAFAAVGAEEVQRVWVDLTFACNASLLRRQRHGECRQLTDESVSPPRLRTDGR